MHKELPIAQVAIISSGITLIILLSLGFVFKETLVNFVVESSDTPEVAPASLVTLSTNDQVVETIAKVNDAVVSVVVTKEVPVFERYYENLNPWGTFGGFSVPRLRENGTQEREVGGGSGFIVSNDGMIVTNRHVVDDIDARYTVLLNDGTSYEAKVLARDPQLDIAILQIDEPLKAALTHVTFGDSEALQLGEAVIAIGNALAEFRNSVSVGVVSGLARSITASDGMGGSEQLDQVIQTDAAINPGNSGGPLLNLAGKVIGVNVATSRGAENISFALPAHIVKRVVESVAEYGEIVRPYLGVRYVMINEQIAEINELPVSYGALIIRGQTAAEVAVAVGSPAEKAGITENTILLAIDGVALQGIDLATILRGKSVGEIITLDIIQDNEQRTVAVELEKAL